MGLFDLVSDAIDIAEETTNVVVDTAVSPFLDQDDIDSIKAAAKLGADAYTIASVTGFGIDAVKEVLGE